VISMKKKNVPVFFVFAVAAIAMWVFLSDPFSTLSRADRKIPLEDHESITCIVLIRGNDTLILSFREEGIWAVNQRYEAGLERVKRLLGWLQRLDIQAPVSRPENELSDSLPFYPFRLKLFEGKRKIRDLYIQTGSADETRFLVKGAGRRQWFLAESYGMDVKPDDLLTTCPISWRSHTLFRLNPADIRCVELTYPAEPGASFRLGYHPDEGFTLRNHAGEPVNAFNRKRAGRYLSYFMNIRFESFPDSEERRVADSLKNTGTLPVFRLCVETTDGTNHKTEYYPVPKQTSNGTYVPDPYRLYGYWPEHDEYFRIRYLDIDPVLKRMNYFLE